jgi:glucosamine-6-phosphate deaminase
MNEGTKMNPNTPARLDNNVKAFPAGSGLLRIYPSKQALGEAAAVDAARIIRNAIERAGTVRIIVATGNSQLDLVSALVRVSGIDWKSVEVFHMDEYVGLPASHPSSFRYWIKQRIEDAVHPGKVHYLNGDAQDIDAEIERYTGLLMASPVHLAFVGFGENGHIAFNDPHVADFEDPAVIKRVTLDGTSRRQQAGEGHFSSPETVPGEALTLTCPALFRAESWICSVPEARKAQAVRNAVHGPISPECPASLFRRHANAAVYLDEESAGMLDVKGALPHAV